MQVLVLFLHFWRLFEVLSVRKKYVFFFVAMHGAAGDAPPLLLLHYAHRVGGMGVVSVQGRWVHADAEWRGIINVKTYCALLQTGRAYSGSPSLKVEGCRAPVRYEGSFFF